MNAGEVAPLRLLASLFGALENYFYWLFGIYKNIDLFITPSKFLKNKFIEFGIPEKKIVYLPNFVKAQKCHPEFQKCHPEFISGSENINTEQILKQVQNDKKQNNYLLYFGRLSKEKGIDILIKAMALVNSNIKLKIVGDGSEKENLKKMAEKLKINSQIQFLDHKNQNELKKIIKNSLTVIVPSQWYENCPLSILEAFSFGKSVVASNLGGISELVEEEKTGFLFEPGNAKDLAEKINLLLASEGDTTSCRLQDKLNLMGKFAQEEIEKKYNPEIHYQKLMEIYESLLSS